MKAPEDCEGVEIGVDERHNAAIYEKFAQKHRLKIISPNSPYNLLQFLNGKIEKRKYILFIYNLLSITIRIPKSTHYKSWHDIAFDCATSFEFRTRGEETRRDSSGKLGIQRGQIAWWSCVILPRKRHTLPLYESRTIHAPRSQGRSSFFFSSFPRAHVNHRFIFSHTRALQVGIEFSDFTTERFEDITPSVKLIQIILDNIDRDCTMSVYRKRERTLLFVLVLLLARNNNYERKKNTVNVVQCRS